MWWSLFQAPLDHLAFAFDKLVDTIAPPVLDEPSPHRQETIQLWLNHDIEGYECIPVAVCDGFAEVLEQVVASKTYQPSDTKGLHAVSSANAALSLSEKALRSHIENHSKTKQVEKPTTDAASSTLTKITNLYLRIQPFFDADDNDEGEGHCEHENGNGSEKAPTTPWGNLSPVQQSSFANCGIIRFMLLLVDPNRSLTLIRITPLIGASMGEKTPQPKPRPQPQLSERDLSAIEETIYDCTVQLAEEYLLKRRSGS